MDTFFSQLLGFKALADKGVNLDNMGQTGSASVPFHAAAKGVQAAGHLAYNVLIVVAIFVSLIMLLIYFGQLYASSNAQERNMHKQKVMKGIVIIALIFMVSGIVLSVAGAVYNIEAGVTATQAVQTQQDVNGGG